MALIPDFEVGTLYNRKRDIHGRFGGQGQGGISTPAGKPFMFLFTGETGEQYGYKDGWNQEGVFLYTGEGQSGDMQFVRGNKSLRDHASDGKDLFLFEALGKGKPYRYVGQFMCASWELRDGPDVKDNDRKVILFHLLELHAEGPELTAGRKPSNANLEQLRAKAMQAAAAAPEANSKSARRIYYERSVAVRTYVLARANGICECCSQPAPFLRVDGEPYLEPHHTKRLSDGGPDDPRWVAGVCPNCHRRIHHGQDGLEQNARLRQHLHDLEVQQSKLNR